mmetsp:Transcript_39124/g.96298  ORF Transcript_39124/g.96298 Transcript_39124/m.96298 type:complete len:159 (-) Transcript_39124:172-648(-)|eukprot:CAMPEP_0206282296 /NCGR_PEP_ID=MMETSP0047_2-20121206/39611_1 /ASSEMBLY_ACC=CAM_ASM_000192 /TAXON_ID=195065 /ORGANISM="Chroomonas mesostigmatica_cf, Strain CCMP1168" /LENGTH=158 /DNA_ID=CAMNT_0053712565 /DNA_START=73 /DNA_END=549 /DNA_ORIENTATION=+
MSRGGTSAGTSRRGSDSSAWSAKSASEGVSMTLLEKRMLEKKSGNYLLESDIKNIFEQFDRDGNGYLGASDLASVYRSLGENLDDDLIDELIREADKDGDGQIAYPEFHTLVKILEEEGGGMRDPNARTNLAQKKGMKRKDSSSESDDSDSESSSGSY